MCSYDQYTENAVKNLLSPLVITNENVDSINLKCTEILAALAASKGTLRASDEYTVVETLGGDLTANSSLTFETLFNVLSRGLFNTPDVGNPQSVSDYTQPLLPQVISLLQEISLALRPLSSLLAPVSFPRTVDIFDRSTVEFYPAMSIRDAWLSANFINVPTNIFNHEGQTWVECKPMSMPSMSVARAPSYAPTDANGILVPRCQFPIDGAVNCYQPPPVGPVRDGTLDTFPLSDTNTHKTLAMPELDLAIQSYPAPHGEYTVRTVGAVTNATYDNAPDTPPSEHGAVFIRA